MEVLENNIDRGKFLMLYSCPEKGNFLSFGRIREVQMSRKKHFEKGGNHGYEDEL
jgi:hypothetical protein